MSTTKPKPSMTRRHFLTQAIASGSSLCLGSVFLKPHAIAREVPSTTSIQPPMTENSQTSDKGRQTTELQSREVVQLPKPVYQSSISVEEACLKRRSVREFSNETLSISQLSQILWAAQGITEQIEEPPAIWRGEEWMGGLRTAPSAGALYPIELYITVGRVQGVAQGQYKYQSQQHTIQQVADGDKSDALSNAALDQTFLKEAAVNVILCGNVKRTAFKYGARAERYVQIEVGTVCQNIYLQGYALNLGTVFVGAFRDDAVRSVLELPEEEHPFGIMPIGKTI